MNYNKASFLCSYGISSQLPPSDRMEIAFAGRSNVGKSTAINKIFNRKNLARVQYRAKRRPSTFIRLKTCTLSICRDMDMQR